MCLCATMMAKAYENTVVPMVVNCDLEEISATECNIHVRGAIDPLDVSTIRAAIIAHGYTSVDVTTIPAGARYKLTSYDIKKLFGNWPGDTNNMIPQTTTTLSLKDADITSGVAYGDAGIRYLQNLKKLTCSKTAEGPYFNADNSIETVIVPKIGKDGASGATIGYFHGMTNLKSVSIGTCAAGDIPASCFAGDISLSSVIMNSTNMTAIEASAFANCTALTKVSIPDGVTAIGTSAFENSGLTQVNLPNTLTTIGKLCFSETHLVTVVIPPNVTSFGANAYNYIEELKDVYLLDEDIPASRETFTNNLISVYHYGGDMDASGTVNAADWTNGSRHPVALHFPKTEAARNNYLNPFTRLINDKTQMTALENIYKYEKGTGTFDASINSWQTTNIATYGDWLTNFWDIRNYFNALYPTPTTPAPTPVWKEDINGYRYPYAEYGQYANYSGTNLDPSDPHAGWNQFLIAADDLDDKTWNEMRILERRWYSMVFPFDMTREQVEQSFGSQTEICDFALVAKVGTNTTFYFNKDVNTPTTIYAAHHPYMIFPGTKTSVVYRVSDTSHSNPIGRVICCVDRVKAKAAEATATMTQILVNYEDSTNAANNKTDAFYFVGNYNATNIIPQGTYYWGYQDATVNGFYHMAADGSTWTNKPYWTPYTALVKSNGLVAGLAKVSNMMVLGLDEDDETTRIKFVSNDETKQAANNNRVMNLNGQVVRDCSTNLDGLAKGIYIVNGKKYVVR